MESLHENSHGRSDESDGKIPRIQTKMENINKIKQTTKNPMVENEWQVGTQNKKGIK